MMESSRTVEGEWLPTAGTTATPHGALVLWRRIAGPRGRRWRAVRNTMTRPWLKVAAVAAVQRLARPNK